MFVQPYSQMQFCRMLRTTDAEAEPKLEVFLRKAYDGLDTRKHLSDHLVVAPGRKIRNPALASPTNGLEVLLETGITCGDQIDTGLVSLQAQSLQPFVPTKPSALSPQPSALSSKL